MSYLESPPTVPTVSAESRNLGAATTEELSRSPTDLGLAEDGTTSKPRRGHWFRFIIFMLMGMSNLLPWNSILNAIPAMQQAASNRGISITVTAAYCSALLVVTVGCLFLNLTRRWALHVALGLTMVASLCFALGIQFGTPSSSPAIFHIIGLILGGASSMYGCSLFGFAGLFPENFCAAASTGLGVAGVYTFAWWMMGKYLFFPSTDESSTLPAAWLLISLVLVVMVVTLVLTVTLFRTQAGMQVIRDLRESRIPGSVSKGMVQDADVELKVSSSPGDSGVLAVVKQAWVPGSCYGLTMCITLFCFPSLGPHSWSGTDVNKDIIVGLFQVFDLLGRYASVLLPSLALRTRGVVYLSLGRILFVCAFILSAAFPKAVVLGQVWYHCILMSSMAITNGWACTCCSQLIPRTVSIARDVARASAFGLVCCYSGIVAGQWLAVPVARAFS